MNNVIEWSWKNYNKKSAKKLNKIRRAHTFLWSIIGFILFASASLKTETLLNIFALYSALSLLIETLCMFSVDSEGPRKTFNKLNK